MTSRELLRLLAPEFDAVADDDVDAVLALSATSCAPAAWGALYQEGVVRLACHFLELRARGAAGDGGVGPIVREKAGDLERAYGAAVGVLARDGVRATTRHGIEFIALRRQISAGAGAIVV